MDTVSSVLHIVLCVVSCLPPKVLKNILATNKYCNKSFKIVPILNATMHARADTVPTPCFKKQFFINYCEQMQKKCLIEGLQYNEDFAVVNGWLVPHKLECFGRTDFAAKGATQIGDLTFYHPVCFPVWLLDKKKQTFQKIENERFPNTPTHTSTAYSWFDYVDKTVFFVHQISSDFERDEIEMFEQVEWYKESRCRKSLFWYYDSHKVLSMEIQNTTKFVNFSLFDLETKTESIPSFTHKGEVPGCITGIEIDKLQEPACFLLDSVLFCIQTTQGYIEPPEFFVGAIDISMTEIHWTRAHVPEKIAQFFYMPQIKRCSCPNFVMCTNALGKSMLRMYVNYKDKLDDPEHKFVLDVSIEAKAVQV